ncbi:rhodanese-like domain-containing protein [Candidatus Pseudomonas adelgestsugas]|uniref:Molybdopterin biosynthesis protein MoeB n=1 Tax=Candidatus Pseudomonas adelgestsugas TaxID=1302376 RepID=A0ABX5R8A3_9PSED|nr:rhodanese-like domain-containing protein [Candidatus Pseudomonas adelgestsugas]QAX81531.1 molybdopterin biosynthesis protein MoeB [Candidatus Pseudomonas adelgestsugas]
MVDQLIVFITTNYLLVAAFIILLTLLIAYEISLSGRSLSTSELIMLVNKNKDVIVDIRPVKDFTVGHIFGAINIPHDKLIARLVELEKYKAKTIILVDAQGRYAGINTSEMLKAGFIVAKLSGGISSWKANNLLLVK